MTKEKFLQIASIAFNGNEQLALSLLKSEIGDFYGVSYPHIQVSDPYAYRQCSTLAYLCYAYTNNYVDDSEMEFIYSDELTGGGSILTTLEIPIPVSDNKINRYMHTVCNDVQFIFENETSNS